METEEETMTYTSPYLTFICPILTGEDDEKDDGDVDEEELKISQVTEDLRTRTDQICLQWFSLSCGGGEVRTEYRRVTLMYWMML